MMQVLSQNYAVSRGKKSILCVCVFVYTYNTCACPKRHFGLAAGVLTMYSQVSPYPPDLGNMMYKCNREGIIKQMLNSTFWRGGEGQQLNLGCNPNKT